MAPIRRHIEEWFKKTIDKLTDEGKKTVEMVPVTVDERNKRTSEIK
jgi:cytochrome oxidase Cu insertion factor (SCO1/SenC/PrrC family)